MTTAKCKIMRNQKKIIRIIKGYDWPNLLRQSPEEKGIWKNIHFTEQPIEDCDYVIILNPVRENTIVNCPPENIWYMTQEPATESHKWRSIKPKYSYQMFTTDNNVHKAYHIKSQACLPWHINKTYDFLNSNKIPEKTGAISWITSRLKVLKGHKTRMNFLNHITGKIDLDLISTYEYYLRNPGATRKSIEEEQAKLGFICAEDKWAGLAPYRYSLAVENFSNPFYWTEKLIDAYLSWCMPIYYGCSDITKYFPKESLILIDINKPDEAIAIIKKAIANNTWEKNLESIAYARELILKKYQLFPFITEQISAHEAAKGSFLSKQKIKLSIVEKKQPSILQKAYRKARRRLIPS